MSILALLILAQQSALTGAPPAEAEQSITVTGQRLEATGAALAQCLARHCPPAEDIAASIAHAENQVIVGDFEGARGTLGKARARNKRHAAALPEPVSALLLFEAEVASLLGYADYGRIATMDSVSALKAGLPGTDKRIATQRLLVADVFLREGRYETAVKMYDAVARQADEAGWTAVKGSAMFRALRFYAMAASVNAAYLQEARRRYTALRATTDPALRQVRDASVVLEAKLILLSDKTADVDAVMRRFSGVRTASPMLVITPLVDLGTPGRHDMTMVPPPVIQDQWVDFSFRVTRDGGVADLDIVARSDQAGGRWIEQAQAAIADRRYLPLDIPAGAPGFWRRERYMLVADRETPKASRIRKAMGDPKLRIIDLTPPTQEVAGAPTQ